MDYRDLVEAHGITCSMSRRGNCLDNAAMESWFSTVKFELGETFESIHLGKEQLFDYIEVFYNQQRRHSSIDYVSVSYICYSTQFRHIDIYSVREHHTLDLRRYASRAVSRPWHGKCK